MTPILLTAEQARIVAGAQGAIPAQDPSGHVVGYFDSLGITPEEIAEARRRAASPGPWFKGERVQAHLQALEAEWQRTGGFDEAYLMAFLDRLRAEEGR